MTFDISSIAKFLAPKLPEPPNTKITIKKLRDPDPKKILSSGKLHPILTQKVKALLEKAQQKELDVMLFEGPRSLKRQAEILDKGKGYTKAKAGQSFHNYGLAVDIVFRDPKTGSPSWDVHHDWKKLGELGKEEGLIWGGDWKMGDLAHFQYPPHMTGSRLQKTYQQVGLQKLWAMIR